MLFLDLYSLLGVARNTSDVDLKRAYRKKALALHPDKNANGAGNGHADFLHVSEAFAVLSNAQLRAAYDKDEVTFMKAKAGQGPYTLDSAIALFGQFFGTDNPFAAVDAGVEGLFPTEEQRKKPAPTDIKVTLPVTLGDLYQGCTKMLAVQVQKQDAASGVQFAETRTLNVKVQPGWCDGSTVKFPKQHDDLTGDIVITLEQEQHPQFSRSGNDLHVSSQISLLQALTGCSVDVTAPDGRLIHVQVDEVVDAGFVKVVPGEGMPDGSGSKGNLLIHFDTLFPKTLHPLQTELIRAALSLPKDVSDERRKLISDALAGKVQKPASEEEE